MAVSVARQVEIGAGADGELVAVQRDLVVDPEKRIVAEVEKTLIAKEDGEGNVHVLEQTRIQAIAVDEAATSTPAPPQQTTPQPPPMKQPIRQPIRQPPPSRQPPSPQRQPTRSARSQSRRPRSTTSMHTPLIPASDRSKLKIKKKWSSQIQLSGCWFCSLTFLAAGATLIGLGVSLVLPCHPLQPAAISIVAFGCLTVLVGCTCCCFAVRLRGAVAFLCCLVVGLLLGLMLGAAATESSYGLGNDFHLSRNGSLIHGCKYDDSAILPVSLVVVSYALLALTFLYYVGTCIHAMTSTSDDPYLYRERF